MAEIQSRVKLDYALRGKRVWVAGHNGMVGSALTRRLQKEDCTILTVEHREVDLTRQDQTESWMRQAKPDAIFLSAAKVGGILANDSYPAEFIYDNLVIETNVIHTAYEIGVDKLLFLGSSCIYPKLATQPIVESELLSGPLEPTNQWYAIAKIAGIKLCQAYRTQHGCNFISAMPTNLYGPGDNFDLNSGHVLPALLRRTHEAKMSCATSMKIWGTGMPMREFMHVDDCADALVFLMQYYSDEDHINVGSGEDLKIKDLALMIMKIADFDGKLLYDTSKPDGTPRKLMSSDRLAALGWRSSIELEDGIKKLYKDLYGNENIGSLESPSRNFVG
jgi:GDP-L-fucose synthase